MDKTTHDRRGKSRIRTDITARYFIKGYSLRYQECQIIDLSRSGAAVKFPGEKDLKYGREVFIEILVPGSLQQLNLQGRIKRTEGEEEKNIGGIRFNALLDEMILEKLTR